MPTNPHDPPFRDSWKACGLVIALTVAAALAIQLPHFLHHDVAYLAWVAGKVMHGSVFGRDVLEINPPLSFMLYWPATLLSNVMPYDLAIKLWVAATASLSIACVWQTAGKHIRLAVIVALGLYFVLALPAEYGQREQFALLLCAPYVSGNAERRGLAILNGLMAGIGFALKPYFLIPLLLVWAARRKVRGEEWTIAAVGIVYAAVVLVFFQPWLFEMLPRLLPIYWSNNVPFESIALIAGMIPVLVFSMWLIAAPQPGTISYSLAALGFAAAVVIHHKGFAYQFITCFGFLALYLAALLFNGKSMARMLALFGFLPLIAMIAAFDYYSVQTLARRDRTVPPLLAEIDSSKSFIFLSDDNASAFPAAVVTPTPYLGIGPSNIYMASVARIEHGLAEGDLPELRRLAVDQSLRELGRAPDLVVVLEDWSPKAQLPEPFDGLAWLRQDPRFDALWQNYAPAGEADGFRFYRRK